MLRNAERAACFDGRLCSKLRNLLGQTKRRRHRRQAPGLRGESNVTRPVSRRGRRSCGDVDQHCTQVQAGLKVAFTRGKDSSA